MLLTLRTPYLRKLEKAVAVRDSLLEGSPANFNAAGTFFPDFPAARNAIPAKVWALSGKETGCRKIGPAFGNAPGFVLSETAQPSSIFLNITAYGGVAELVSRSLAIWGRFKSKW